MVIPTIVTLAQLQGHLRLPLAPDGSPPSISDADLQQKLDAATQLVCEYIADRQPADSAWIAEIEGWGLAGSPPFPAPPLVVLAVMEQCGDFFRFRGDDATDDRVRDRGYLIPAVANLLTRYHDPVVA
jgi:hypothetical protein